MTSNARGAALAAVLALAVLALAGLTQPAGAQTSSSAMNAEGVLTMQWGDARPGVMIGGMRYQLNTADGGTIPVDLPPGQHTAAVAAFNKRVAVIGRATTGRSGVERLAADRIVLLEEAHDAARELRATTTRKVLYVLLRYAGDSQQPHTPAFFKALTNPPSGNTALGLPSTINGYFNRVSWGSLQWQGDVVGVGGLAPTAWFTLPGNKASYAPCGWSGACADLTKLGNDAMALVKKAGVNPANYNNISFVINNDLDCCAWGGGFFFEGRSYGATWEPPWGQEASVYVHEYGHSIGLPHSGWRYYAYDSNWDDMSRGSRAKTLACGSYKSANSGGQTSSLSCSQPSGNYIAAHKEKMGWLPAARQIVVNTVGTRTVTIESMSLPLATAAKAVKICLKGFACTGTSARFLTVEAKLRSNGDDLGLPGEGILIHDVQMNRGPIGSGNSCFFNTQSGWAVPIDATPGDWTGPNACSSGGRPYPNYALHNAQFGVGKSYVDNTLGVRVDVLSRSGNFMNVRVTKSK